MASIPQAWPLLLTIDQLCAYLGGMDERTLKKICTVSPVDLGAGLLRWRRPDIDTWVATMPPRLLRWMVASHGAAPINDGLADEPAETGDRRLSAVERARARAGAGRCRKRA